jgi:hypothetical protein
MESAMTTEHKVEHKVEHKTAAETAAEKNSEEEIQKLRDQIAELNAKLEAKQDRRRHIRQDERDDLARDLPVRAQEEVGRLVRGLTHAYLEQLREGASILDAFVEEVFPMTTRTDDDYDTRTPGRTFRRTTRSASDDDLDTRTTARGDRNQGTAKSVSDLSGDVYGGVLRAVNRSLSLPHRAVDRFYDTYHDRDRATSNS